MSLKYEATAGVLGMQAETLLHQPFEATLQVAYTCVG